MMEKEPGLLEKEAHGLLGQGKVSEAYALFKNAGDCYKENGQQKEAALCLASAASCWAMKSGEKTFYNASLAYQEAACAAELAGDLEYASLLYRQAAINFERDMEFLNFSECFYSSRESLRKFLGRSLFSPKNIHPIGGFIRKEAQGTLEKYLLWFSLTFSALIWGHGERPARTFYAAVLMIFVSGLFYMLAGLSQSGLIFKPGFFEALYFSVVTFTTVGYGDIIPVGVSRLIAVLEVFSGMFVIPLFIVGLSRKYLRT